MATRRNARVVLGTGRGLGGSGGGGGGGTTPPPSGSDIGGWTRPGDWLPTTVTAGEQKIQGLVAVYPDTTSNWCTVAAWGAYTVDWGDGSPTESGSASLNSPHQYDFDALPDNTTSEGWRQAIVTVTPQSGATLTSIALNQVPPGGASQFYTGPYKEVVFGPGTITSCSLGGSTTNGNKQLEHIQFLSPITASIPTSGFGYLASLVVIEGEITVTGTLTSAFTGCASLKVLPDLNTSAVTAFNNMFYLCGSLETIPPLDTSAGTTFDSMFEDCFALRSVPALNTSNGTVFTSMFDACHSLVSIPSLDMSRATSTSNTFVGCTSLRNLTLTAGPPISFALVGQLDAATLDAIYTSLPTVTGQTITITNTPGSAGDDPTIAQAKGWTVTGT
jgi:hypothetical protein